MEIGLAEAGFHLISFVSDIPTGGFADRFGHRISLGMGLLIGAATTVATYWLAPRSVPLGIVSIAVGALSLTFIGGADRALLFHIVGDPKAFGRAYGLAMSINLLTGAAAMALGGWLVSQSGWAGPYILSAATSLLGMAALPFLPAARPQSTPSSTETFLSQLGRAVSEARRVPGLMPLITFGAIFATLVTINSLYAQSTFVAKGATVAWVSGVVAGSNVLAAVSSYVAGRLPVSDATRYLIAGTVLLGGLMAAIGVSPYPAVVGPFLGIAAVSGILDTFYETQLISLTPEAVRATVLSAPTTGFSLGMMVLFPVVGWALGSHQFSLVYGILGVALAISSTMIRRARHDPA